MAQTERFKKSQLFYFKEISTKLIFGRSADLNLGNGYELEIILAASKDDWIEEKDEKTKAK